MTRLRTAKTTAEKIARLEELVSKPKPDGTLNLRVTNGIHDTGWMELDKVLVRRLIDAMKNLDL